VVISLFGHLSWRRRTYSSPTRCPFKRWPWSRSPASRVAMTWRYVLQAGTRTCRAYAAQVPRSSGTPARRRFSLTARTRMHRPSRTTLTYPNKATARLHPGQRNRQPAARHPRRPPGVPTASAPRGTARSGGEGSGRSGAQSQRWWLGSRAALAMAPALARDANGHPDGRPDEGTSKHVTGVVVCHANPCRADPRRDRKQTQPQWREQAGGRRGKRERIGGMRGGE
jgi:hypothetical protein